MMMTDFFGLDFGTANTVLYRYTEDMPAPVPVVFSEIAIQYDNVPVIPSIIQYLPASQIRIGAQITKTSAHLQPKFFRWMKHYQLHRNPYRISFNNNSISSSEAANKFLRTLLERIIAESAQEKHVIAVSVPVDAYEPYENWLISLCEEFSFQAVHLIDEASAAAIGVGIQRLPNQIVCVVDFGAGSLDVSIVKFDNMADQDQEQQQRCTVLSKNGASLGGLHIDQWLYEAILNQSGVMKHDPRLASSSADLLQKCEALKIQLSTTNHASLGFQLDGDRQNKVVQISRADFNTILHNHHFHDHIKQTIQAALAALSLKGFSEENIDHIICIGGSSHFPALIQLMNEIFPTIPISTEHAMDAVSCGAALFASGQPFFNHIQHDYALRYYNQEQDEYQYRILVKKGTPYPSQLPIAEFFIKATYENQQRFGIPIYEINQETPLIAQNFELFFTPQGAVQFLPITPIDQKERSEFWLNEANPTFLFTEAPTSIGETCFKISFTLDQNKRLLVSTYDMIEQRWVLQNHPVVRLI
jgi:molecular chaperone DnaK (HSP70)